MDIFKNESESNPVLELTYRDEASKLVFDKKNKHFAPEKKTETA